jgi:protease-4
MAIVAVILLALVGSCGLGTYALFSGSGVRDITDGDGVALIHIDSAIAGTGSGNVTPEDILDQLKQAEDDDSVKAVLLRIDSPGGTASASNEIAMQVARMKKPVVASIGDMGASGAYMIAAQCDHIIATPSSAVGSIGVIQAFPNVEELMKKLGVRYTTITQGEYKQAGSPFRSLSATETRMLEEQTRVVYDAFIEDVAKGRKMSPAKVRELATGWVWTGTEAKKLGLVDSIGNYSDALAKAGKLGGIEGEPQVVTYGAESLSDVLNQLTGLASQLGGSFTRGTAGSLLDRPVPR